jgi:hypothetical protein
VGWEDIAHEVESIFDRLPDSERNGTIIVSAFYGVPGALQIYGDKGSLPVIVSPQLSDWYWLPGNLIAKSALMVDYEPSDVSWTCSSATLIGRLTVPYGVQGLEQGAPVTFCVLKGPDPGGLETASQFLLRRIVAKEVLPIVHGRYSIPTPQLYTYTTYTCLTVIFAIRSACL